MRNLRACAGVAIAVLVFGPLTATAQAAPPPQRAELVAKAPTASYADGKVSAGVVVKNKGNKSAKASQTGFFLSTDAVKGATDPALGTLRTPRLKPKTRTTVLGAFALPAGLQPGAYRVIACVDVTSVVKERKEGNNCKTTPTSVSVPGGPPLPGQVTVAAISTAGGSVAASGITGGSCTGTFCTLASGAGSVTFTPTASPGHEFTGWTGATCSGYTGSTAITFTNPTQSKACTAGFVRLVTVGWTVNPLLGTVTASAVTGGTCTSNPLTGAGSCTLVAGASTVTLTAAALLGLPLVQFDGWQGATCDGTKPPPTATEGEVVFTNPAGDKSCTAEFSLGLPI